MPEFNFTKSSYSQLSQECIEVARNLPGVVAVRDSKAPDSPILRLSLTAWREFTAAQ